MNGRLTTSFDVENKIVELQKVLKLTTKAAVMRLAIGISLKMKTDPEIDYPEKDNDHGGSSYQKMTIFGDYDEIYKVMIINHLDKEIDEKKIFPAIVNSHIARGVNMLIEEYQLKGNYDKVVDTIFELL